MDVPINYLAVLSAAVLSMVIGSVWYGPLFGKAWMKEIGMKPQKMTEAVKKKMMNQYGMMFVGSLVMAWVLANAIVFSSSYMQMQGASAGAMSGFFNWLGFVAPVTLSAVLFEGKSWKMWCINNGYYLITLVAMGKLLAMWS
jgi:hypothetical protein